MARRKRGRRNFGVTVNDDRWEAFVKRAIELGKIELRVGILRAGTKYPAGWVGTKSREKDNQARFADLAGGRRAETMLAAYRGKKKKAPGFARKARRKRIDVAKVAAVVGYEAGKRPKIPGMWARTVDRNEQFVHQKAKVAMTRALNGETSRAAIENMGAKLKAAFRADVMRSGHVDTRLLLNAVNWELVDSAAQEFAKRIAKARRIARKQQKAAGGK